MFQRISSLIPDNELTKIKFLKSALTHWKSIDEFEYHGKMYDVVSVEDKGTYVVYSCLNDKNEEALLKHFKKHFDHEKTRSTNNKHFQLITFTGVLHQVFSLQRDNNLFGQIRTTNSIYISFIEDISSPPPRNSFV